MQLVGEINPNRSFRCVDCGTHLWGDNGYIQDRQARCVLENRCIQRQARAQLDELTAQGIKPRWR
jgi:hypothetical protein